MTADFDEDQYLSLNPDVAVVVQIGLFKTGLEHYIWHGRAEGRAVTAPESGPKPSSSHRDEAARIVSGSGIEIGALDRPCPVGESTVLYCDRFDDDEAIDRFPQAANPGTPRVDCKLNLDTEGLGRFADASQDFVIANNVLQQLANPLRAVFEAFRITRPGGHVVLSAPDKRFSPDRFRRVTPWEHLLGDYEKAVTTPSGAHYVDVIALYFPSDFKEGVAAIESRIQRLRRYCYPPHVWDTEGFGEMMKRALLTFGIETELVFQAGGDETHSECFVIYRKG